MTATEVQPAPVPHEGEVWYVSYGSNMSAARLACYIEGGCPPGGSRVNPGARDPRLPRHSIGVELPGSVYFAGESSQWGGGVAFYDHQTPGPAAGRAYLVTAQQFADIAAQEMFRVPDPDDPIEEIVLGALDPHLEGRHHVGPGHYETLVEVGRVAGAPMLTFTAPHGIDHVEHNEPSPSYLATLAAGLREAHGWDDERIEGYFERLRPPG
ncbi:MAG: histone deacetylase [Actinomycetota bacterium]